MMLKNQDGEIIGIIGTAGPKVSAIFRKPWILGERYLSWSEREKLYHVHHVTKIHNGRNEWLSTIDFIRQFDPEFYEKYWMLL